MQAAESRSQAGRGPKIQSEGCHRLNLCVLTTETPGTWYTTLKDISVDKWPQRSRAPSPQCLGTPRTQQQSGGRGNCHSLSFHYLNECSHNMMIKFRVSVSSCFRNKTTNVMAWNNTHLLCILWFCGLWVWHGFSLDKTQELCGAVFLLEMLGEALAAKMLKVRSGLSGFVALCLKTRSVFW